MDQSDVTITLPLTEHGLGVILTALGIGVATWLVYLILAEQGRAPRKKPASLLTAFAVIMAPVWLVIFAGTLWQVWLMLSGVPSAEGTGPSLGMGALLAALLGAPFLVWGTVLKQRTVDFQKEGHITERITAAVEQLGAEKTVKKIIEGETQETSEPNIEVRIGAILSLERIAQDSTRYDRGRDHVRVMEILCAYVRENSNARPPQNHDFGDLEPLRDFAAYEERADHIRRLEERFGEPWQDGKVKQWAKCLPKPRADIAQALQVLGRRTAEQRLVESAWPDAADTRTVWPFDTPCPELREGKDDAPLIRDEIDAFKKRLEKWRTTLRDYSGYRLDLRGANLQGADLSANRPDASDAVFSGVLLQGARMEGALLRMARIEGVDLVEARMEGSNLSYARMAVAHLLGSRLESADLFHVNMTGVDLFAARLENAKVWYACLHGANLGGTCLENADLSGASMQAAYINDAKMERTDLRTVLFHGVTLKNLDFCNVRISFEQVNSAFGDASVILPEDIARPAHWPNSNSAFGVNQDF